MDESITFITDGLKQCNYPKINTMNQSEIIDILSKANRQFLVCWFFKQLNGFYGEIVDKATKEDLALLVYNNGFCKISDKQLFINGECDISIQISILYKMTKLLKDVKSSIDLHNDPLICVKEIENLFEMDSNLFPNYGPKKIFTSIQRSEKMSEFQKEVVGLREALTKNLLEEEFHFDNHLNENLSKAMSHLDRNINSFYKIFIELMNNENLNQSEIFFDGSFATVFEKCADSFGKLDEFLENMNVIVEFKETKPEIRNCFLKLGALVRELAEKSNQVSNLRKDSNICV